MEQLLKHGKQLAPTLFKRAHHVISENQAGAAVEALGAADHRALGVLLNQSHTSLRDDFEVSCKELDYLAEVAQITPGVHGARMFGGGFGGCVLVLANRADLATVAARIVDEYTGWSGQDPWHHQVVASGPAARVPAA